MHVSNTTEYSKLGELKAQLKYRDRQKATEMCFLSPSEYSTPYVACWLVYVRGFRGGGWEPSIRAGCNCSEQTYPVLCTENGTIIDDIAAFHPSIRTPEYIQGSSRVAESRQEREEE